MSEFRRMIISLLSILSLMLVGLVTSAPVSSAATDVPIAGCSTSKATGATATRRFPVTGAKANGVADDRGAIQAAINAASAAGGGVVSLPSGVLLINAPLMVKRNVKLQGTGAATTTIKAGPDFLATSGPIGGHPLITTYFANNVTIADLTADQSGDTFTGTVSGRLNEFLVDLRQSTNVVLTGVRTVNPFTYSIAAASSKRFCIVRNTTGGVTSGRYNQLDGIHVINSNTGDVANNTVDQGGATDGDDGLVAHAYNGSVHDVRYVDNTVRGGRNGHGMQFAFEKDTDQIYNIYIARNEFWGAPQGILTGWYGSRASLHDITIADNYFHDNARTSLDLTGRVSNVSVTNNQACRSGAFNVPTGNNNVISGTTGC